METIAPIQIPDSHISFAKAVAAMAESHGIARFQMTFEANREEAMRNTADTFVSGDLRIDYRAQDGRGRPCENLSITFAATHVHRITTNPESSN